MKISVITPTHDVRWLKDTWESLKRQTLSDFEWVVTVNSPKANQKHLANLSNAVKTLVEGDLRVHVFADERPHKGIGQRKKFAFMLGTGRILVELDHDDILVPTALEEIRNAFARDTNVGFVYSDWADFQDADHWTTDPQGHPPYRRKDVRAGWEKNGFLFYPERIEGIRPGTYECVRAFEPTALSTSLVYWAPNHVRAWRRDVYDAVGGHNEELDVCDDHDLVCRTYLATKMVHIPKPLYLYRVTGEGEAMNTWQQNIDRIKRLTWQIHHKYLERLVLRQCYLDGLTAVDLSFPNWPREDLGETYGPIASWTKVGDFDLGYDLRTYDKLGVIGAIKAHDRLCRMWENKIDIMRLLWKALVPGGWLLSSTPSTDGRGAFQDPSHTSYWNENSFWYWTRQEQSKFLPAAPHLTVRFQEVTLATEYPSRWHEEHKIPYVRANLVALKEGYSGPGEKLI